MFLKNLVWSSTGKKYVMGLTGLCLISFAVIHLIGNILYLIDAEAFNRYAHFLISHPLIYIAEVALLSLFLIHISFGAILSFQNFLARPKRYFVNKYTGRGSSFFTYTMPYSGFILLVALIAHITQIKYGTYYSVTYNLVEMRDLHKLLTVTFSRMEFVTLYAIFMLVLGLHLNHGFHSAFQSFGLSQPKYTSTIKILSSLLAVFFILGFSIVPIWSYFFVGVN